MSYYKHQMMIRNKIRTKWIPAIQAGAEVTINMILYDLDKSNFEYSKKSVVEYVERFCDVEGFTYDGVKIKK